MLSFRYLIIRRWLLMACLVLLISVFLAQGGDASAGQLVAHLLPRAPVLGIPFTAVEEVPECLGCSIILISIDTMRPDHLGCYGHDRPTSPSIDRFAEEATLFRVAISQASTTLRSHATMLTSLFTFQHRANRRPARPVPEEATTLAEVLRQEGYQTAAFTGGGQLDPIFGLTQGFDVYDDQSGRDFATTVADSIEWLEAEPRSKFFLFLHTYEVHAPYEPDPELFALLEDDSGSLLPTQISVDLIDRLNTDFFGRPNFRDADARKVALSYDAEIMSVDRAFGGLVEYLRESGTYDDLMIVLTADHGEEFGEHGTVGGHAQALYDEIIKVPLIIKFPRRAFAAVSVNSQVRIIDIPPTITDVLGIPRPPSFEGADLVDLVNGKTRAGLVAISERGNTRPSYAVRTDRWKLYDGRLFDLAADPREREDVADRYDVVRRGLELQLAKFLSMKGLDASEEEAPPEEVLRQLRALGYVQ